MLPSGHMGKNDEKDLLQILLFEFWNQSDVFEYSNSSAFCTFLQEAAFLTTNREKLLPDSPNSLSVIT